MLPYRLHLVLYLLTLTQTALAQELTCHWTSGPVVIDGAGADDAWKSAEVVTDFRVPESLSKPRTATAIRFLWDRQNLYFLAELEDRDLFADVLEHDGQTWHNDVLELFLKPHEQHSGYFEFQVNAAGTTLDLFLPDSSSNYESRKSVNNFHWTTAVSRKGTLDNRTDDDTAWTVEGAIPWIDLLPAGGRPDPAEVWKVAVCRYDYTQGEDPELSSCARFSRADFHRGEEYASLKFTGPGESDPGLAAILARPASAATRLSGSPDPPRPYRATRAYPELKLNFPVDVQVEPGSRRLIMITQQTSYGKTQVVRTTLEGEASGLLEELVDPGGLAYSIAFHPKFEHNGWMYIGSNGKVGDAPNKSRIVRYQLARTAPFQILGDPVTILEWDSNGHNGVAMAFGQDGMMYITSGDGTSDSDENVVGQDLSTLLAKVLRIDVDHPDAERTYSIPPDNPFVGTSGVREETWAYGLRNPWRMTADPKTGQIWVGNNGQDMWEQAYLLQRGANYGWSVYEGSHPFYLNRTPGPTPLVPPTVEHPHSESRSLTGGVVYHGRQLQELSGAYIYGDYSTGKIWAIRHDGQKPLWHREIADTQLQISAITLDPDGELLIVDHRGDGNGGVYRLEPNPSDASPHPFPTRLSETGLFSGITQHEMAPGVIPYSVTAPLWSDGALKERWMALPINGTIELTNRWAWGFPDQTVLVKSFSFETAVGNPNSRKWIETRLLVRNEGEWVGYSYAWNEAQTDAELVESGGRDVQWMISDGAGTKTLNWHFPSRAECMVCHTRAAGFVLGLTTLQMNRLHDYGDGVPRNQLEVLEGLGVLRSPWVEDARQQLRESLVQTGIAPDDAAKQAEALQTEPSQRKVRSTTLLGKHPSRFESLTDPYDSTGDLTLRARSYLHANCAYCHTEAGGGNAQINLEFGLPPERMKILDVVPMHHTFGKSEARIVAAGAPDRSVLLHRIATRGAGQMPQLGTAMVDQQAVDMLQEWISQVSTGQPVK